MKIAFVTMLWASICCVVIPINGQTASKDSGTGQAQSSQAQPPKINTVGVDTVNVTKLTVQQQTEPTGESDKNEKDSKPYFLRLFAPESLPNWALCIVGIAGIAVAVCTLRAIQRQTKVFQGQLIAMQRPKLAVKRVSVIPGKLVDVNGVQTLQDDSEWRIACVIANIGGSTAAITESDITIMKLGVGTLEELLPSLPPYGGRYSFGPFSIEPGERQEKIIVLDANTDSRLLRGFHTMANTGFTMERSPLICFGYFHYWDKSNVGRRTGFGAQWNADNMRFTWLDSPDYQYTD